ncbi:MAG: NAD(P)H-binding protein [Rhodocyclaceae bacterium]|jgi:uncharacterized protein YbjT (DUF2867 family)|nr:NAD(P)H-binding protein [Rhodocyclaceae bacterium]MCA3033788.1 NAD(P)H-binding protein [Rhodocyclaceae bacterium]MCA3081644.1 NAD(P)H-binding protein [Rhodocyclaceae bacterium]
MKLVVFGASGATGEHVCRLANEAGWMAHAFVRSQAAASQLDPAYVHSIGDPTQPKDVALALVGADAAAVSPGISAAKSITLRHASGTIKPRLPIR